MLNHEVKTRIENGIQDSQCHVKEFSGGIDHYEVLVISDSFKGVLQLIRHRMVMELFKLEIESGEIHALSIQTYTKEQWETFLKTS